MSDECNNIRFIKKDDYSKTIDPRTRLDNYIKGKLHSDLPIVYNTILASENETVIEVRWNKKVV
jgi:hypothetical protein